MSWPGHAGQSVGEFGDEPALQEAGAQDKDHHHGYHGLVGEAANGLFRRDETEEEKQRQAGEGSQIDRQPLSDERDQGEPDHQEQQDLIGWHPSYLVEGRPESRIIGAGRGSDAVREPPGAAP